MGKLCMLLAAATTSLAVAMPASAAAAPHRLAPPGNSGVSQYQEDVPSARGEVPSSSLGAASGAQGPAARGTPAGN
ncbi:MAG: hypothetical protein ACYCYN_05790, partial [Solirubrobacteraceae bacterium]